MEIFELSKAFPREESFSLTDPLRVALSPCLSLGDGHEAQLLNFFEGDAVWGGPVYISVRWSLFLGGVFFDCFQEVIEGHLRRGNVLAGVVERVNMPTYEGIVGAKDPCSSLYEGEGALGGVGIVEDVDECAVSEDHAYLDDGVVENLNVVGEDKLRSVAGFLDNSSELERTQVSH